MGRNLLEYDKKADGRREKLERPDEELLRHLRYADVPLLEL